MIFEWPSYRQKISFFPGVNFLTLMEYDFQLLFISSINDRFYLNYFIDEDDNEGKIRYLHTPISMMQIRALASGSLAIYDCINTKDIHIYDIGNDGTVLFSAELDFSEIPKDALPPKDESIPPLSKGKINELYGFELGDLCFVLSNSDTTHHTLSFNKLSNFLKVTQNIVYNLPLCNKISGNQSVSDDYELKAVALQAASFAIISTTKNECAKKDISIFIPELINFFTRRSPDEVYSKLYNMQKKLISAFLEYCKEILNNKYEFILKHSDGFLYVNHFGIEKIRKNIDAANCSQVEEIEISGYLIGANLHNNSFCFEDIDGNKIYKGKMSRDFTSSHPEITLSKTTCKAWLKNEIEIRFSKITNSYELLKIEMQQDAE